MDDFLERLTQVIFDVYLWYEREEDPIVLREIWSVHCRLLELRAAARQALTEISAAAAEVRG